MTRSDDINRVPTLPGQPIPAGMRQPAPGALATPVMPNHPFAAGAPPVLRQETGAINSPNPAGGYVPPDRFPPDAALRSPRPFKTVP